MLRKSTAGAAKFERHAIEQLDNGQAGHIFLILYFTGNAWVTGLFFRNYY